MSWAHWIAEAEKEAPSSPGPQRRNVRPQPSTPPPRVQARNIRGLIALIEKVRALSRSGPCTAGNAYLGRELGCSDRTIQRRFAEAVSLGLVESVVTRKRSAWIREAKVTAAGLEFLLSRKIETVTGRGETTQCRDEASQCHLEASPCRDEATQCLHIQYIPPIQKIQKSSDDKTEVAEPEIACENPEQPLSGLLIQGQRSMEPKEPVYRTREGVRQTESESRAEMMAGLLGRMNPEEYLDSRPEAVERRRQIALQALEEYRANEEARNREDDEKRAKAAAYLESFQRGAA